MGGIQLCFAVSKREEELYKLDFEIKKVQHEISYLRANIEKLKQKYHDERNDRNHSNKEMNNNSTYDNEAGMLVNVLEGNEI